MKITRIINNNVVCAINDRRQEMMLLGSGIGFQKKKGDEVDRAKIEKEFFLKSKNVTGKLYALLAQIPMEYIRVSDSIIQYAKETLNKELNENIYLTLTDHINFAVARYNKGMNFNNALLSEIKAFYANEFRVAMKALGMINQEFDIELPEDEAGFIALHIVNAELGSDMEETMKITQFIQKVLNLIRYQFNIHFNESSIHYSRLTTHLKFFAYRLFNDNVVRSGDSDFLPIIKEKYASEYQCSLRIAKLIHVDYGKELTDDELVYLTVHIKRVIDEEKNE
ncbi:BglG family transcription antiterminator LicT [Saccharibacillus endophyticus]|uniref:Transcription antiterminator LicT n=1 Tax=Saccharibacillus endophyticus TaxID=2060666 RepID=A0ABQ1ZN62_9BACL|nr:PRD domain-containing protein [Saccharibacillus endophyticus]GGH70325.1 transcription antiterminator LicT [Saccharibacillus endophyticus]